MNTTLKFDRVILVSELNKRFNKVGDMFEVANVLENAFLMRDVKTKNVVGVVSFEDFEKHFVHEENFKGWTSWMPITGFDGQTDAFYRSNGKKVQVKFLTDNVRAEACCNRADEFNLFFGIRLAYRRCLDKALMNKENALNEEMNKINYEIIDNRKIMKRMINSLAL